MKKLVQISLLTIGVFAFFFLTNCKKDKDVNFNIVGTWDYTKHTEIRYTNNVLVSTDVSDPIGSLTFNSDGTGHRNSNSETDIIFNWTFDGTTLTSTGLDLTIGDEIYVVTGNNKYVVSEPSSSKMIITREEEYSSIGGEPTTYRIINIAEFEK